MPQATWNSMAVLVIFLAFATSAMADQSGAVTLDDIRQLRRERRRPAEIVEVIQQRGLGFEINRETERLLRRMGFRRANIDQLKEITPAAVPEEDISNGKPTGDGNTPAAPQSDPLKEGQFQRYAERLETIRKESQTGAVITRSQHITLVCDQALVARFMPDVQRLEQMLAKQFPAPLGVGPDRRVANIVLFATRYDYEKWVRALFKVHEQEGMEFTGMDVLNRAIRTDRFLIEGMFVCCMEKMTPEEARHAVAYAVGYHYIDRITEGKTPVALLTGFGNVTEVMLLGIPTMMLNAGYAERQLGRGGNPWALIVLQRFAQNLVPPLEDVLAYDASAMQLPQYAECWSLTSLLANDAKIFSSLVLALQGGEPPLAAIEKNYGLAADKLHARWRKYATQSR